MARTGSVEALRSLSTLYKFAGSRGAPEEVDIEGPITVVHDVGRLTELSQAIVYVYELTQLTGGGGVRVYTNVNRTNLFGSINVVADAARNKGLTLANSDVWLLDIACALDDGDLAFLGNCAATLQPIEFDLTSTLYEVGLGYWDAALPSASSGLGAWVQLYDSDAARAASLPAKLPRKVGQINVTAVDDGTGGLSLSYRLLIAIVPKGVQPPQP